MESAFRSFGRLGILVCATWAVFAVEALAESPDPGTPSQDPSQEGAVSVGFDHVCALAEDGVVHCW